MCGVVDGGIVAGPVGLRGRPERRRRHLRLVRRPRACPPRYHDEAAAARARRCTSYLTELAGEQAVGAHGLVALDWHNGNRSVLVDHEPQRADRRADAGHARRGHLPRADRGDRLRHPHDRRDVRRRPACPVDRAHRRRRAAQEPGAHADLRRRARGMPLHLIASEQGPALGSAIHAAVAAGAYPDVHAAVGGDGPASRATPTCPTPARADAYDALYAEYYALLHDHFGRGGNDVMHAPARASAPREVAAWLTSSPTLRARGLRAARRAAALRARRLDERQRLGARARARS